MGTALLLAAVLVAALACPAMMWWQRGRGKAAACCVPAREIRAQEVAELRRDQATLSARVNALQPGNGLEVSGQGRDG